jgi:hypothetical protein
MTWDFGSREGRFDVTKFDTAHFGADGLSFGGRMCAPGVAACGTNTPGGNHFGGALSGTLPATAPGGAELIDIPEADRNLDGFALGSFARGPDNIGRSIPQGVIGNWGIGNDRYMASGIFAGAHVPAASQ